VGTRLKRRGAHLHTVDADVTQWPERDMLFVHRNSNRNSDQCFLALQLQRAARRLFRPTWKSYTTSVRLQTDVAHP